MNYGNTRGGDSVWHIDDVFLTDIWKRIDVFNKGLEESCTLPFNSMIFKLKQCWELLKNVLCDYSSYLGNDFGKYRCEMYNIRSILYKNYGTEKKVINKAYNDFMKYPKDEKDINNKGIVYRLEDVKIFILSQMAKNGNLLKERKNVDHIKEYMDKYEFE